MWNLKYGKKEPISETETDSQIQRTDMWLPRGSGERDGWNERLSLVNANCYI